MRYRMITLMLGLMVAGLTPVAAESYKDVKISPQTEVKMHFYDVSAASGRIYNNVCCALHRPAAPDAGPLARPSTS